MNRMLVRAAVAPLFLTGTRAFAQGGPFGVATPEQNSTWGGPLSPIFARIAYWQSEFYTSLTHALSGLHTHASAFWLLAGVSFVYGIFHAAGPGHGKAVISAYLLATGETLRRGVVIAFLSAFVQAVVAVVLVTIAAGVLKVTAVTMNQATDILELGSYALIVVVGVWLLWSRIRGGAHAHPVYGERLETARRIRWPGPLPAEAAEGVRPLTFSATGGRALAAEQRIAAHDHAPNPTLMRRPLTLSSAWTAVLAVGIRPCSGALIILVFALSQKLYGAGIASTFIMALGTALTVSLLATLAVVARDAAFRLTRSGSPLFARLVRAAEILAALAVILLGVLLLGGAIAG